MVDKEYDWVNGLNRAGEWDLVKGFIQKALDAFAFVELYGNIRDDRFLAHITGGSNLGRIDGKLIEAGLDAGLELREVGVTERSYASGQAFVTFRLGY